MDTETFWINSEINQQEIKGDSSDIKQEEDLLENQIIELQNDHQASDWDERCTKENSQSSTADNSSKQLRSKNAHSDIRHKCNICNHQATTKSALNKHKGYIHDGLRYPCSKCDYIAKEKEDLTAHKKSVHEGISFSCNMCSFNSRAKRSLSRHKRTVHLTLKSCMFVSAVGVTDICIWCVFVSPFPPVHGCGLSEI